MAIFLYYQQTYNILFLKYSRLSIVIKGTTACHTDPGWPGFLAKNEGKSHVPSQGFHRILSPLPPTFHQPHLRHSLLLYHIFYQEVHMSGVRFFHKQLGLDAPKLDSLTVTCLLRAVTLASRPSAPALHHITPAAAGRPTWSLQEGVDHLTHISPNQLLLTVTKGTTVIPITAAMLARVLAVKLHSLGLGHVLYALHSLRRGGATAAYRAGIYQLDIKRHGMWICDGPMSYITALCVSTSPMALTLAGTTAATL